MLPAVAASQSLHNFKDAWFWGVKGGAVSFSTTTVKNRSEPLAGIEWLLTRTNSALYLSLDHADFQASSTIRDSLGGLHNVDIEDMRRFTAAAMVFPLSFGTPVGVFRTYAGVGLALNFIQEATLSAPPLDPALREDLDDRLEQEQDRAAPLLILGLQLHVGRLAAFIQGTAMPAENDFLLNGRATGFAEVGLRINAGKSKSSY
jgi:hypothetical protein